MRLYTLVLGMAMVAMGVQAQQVYTLDQCRTLAVDNNAAIKIASGNANAAEEVKKEAFTKYFPTVMADGTWFASNKSVLQYDVANLFSVKLIKNGIGANVSAIQPVFMGGQIINGNKLAQVGVEAGKLQVDNARNDVALTAEKYYWQLASLKAQRHTLESVIAMVDTLQHQVDVAVKAGIVLRNDLLKVQLQGNELRTLMVDLDNGIILARKQLAQYIGKEGEDVDIVKEEVPAEVPPFPTDLFVSTTSALPSTIDYQLLEKQVKAADLRTKMTMGKYMPMVGVGAGYFYDDLLNQNHSFGAVFANITIPISSWWGGSHAIKKSKIEAANARLEMDNLSQMLQLNMDNTWDNLTAAHRKMGIAHESIEQATENLRLNENFYHAGVTTITNLLEAQTMYRKSCDTYTQAYCNFRTARAVYLDATARPLD